MASDDLLRVCYTHEVGMQHLDPDRAAVPAPRDVCECGDARKSHVLERGPCRICRWATRLWEPCRRFRLARAFDPEGRDGDE
jgi:hypothetical protein